MRKYIYILTLLVATLSVNSVQAQSLDDLIKSFTNLMSGTPESTEQKHKVTYPEIYELIGRWNFDGLVVDYTGDNTLASVAVSTLEGQLPLLASKFDLVAGRDYVNIGEDGVITFVSGESRVSAHCNSYNSYNGEVTLTLYLTGKYINVTGVIFELNGKMRVLFDAKKVMELLAQNYTKFSENTTLQMAKTVIDNYPGIRVGIAIKK
ncbi:MAG: DUF4923 family protein [Alistipes sp.]|nr:DUF4923 family protein [Alistipes sp.]